MILWGNSTSGILPKPQLMFYFHLILYTALMKRKKKSKVDTICVGNGGYFPKMIRKFILQMSDKGGSFLQWQDRVNLRWGTKL